jgi:hypothetical protein
MPDYSEVACLYQTVPETEGPLCQNCGDCMCAFCKSSRKYYRGKADCCDKPTLPPEVTDEHQTG